MKENTKFIFIRADCPDELANYSVGLQETLAISIERLDATLKPHLHDSAYDNGIDNIIHAVAILSTASVNLATLVNAFVEEIVKADGDVKRSVICTQLLGRMIVCCEAITRVSEDSTEVHVTIPPSESESEPSRARVHNLSDYVN